MSDTWMELREQIARVIEPDVFRQIDNQAGFPPESLENYQNRKTAEAFAKADALRPIFDRLTSDNKRMGELEALMLQVHDALESARDKMRGAVEPDDEDVYQKVNAALYAVRSRRGEDF